MEWFTAVATTALVISGPAVAGSNGCNGKVTATGWATVVGNVGDYAPNGCRFRTNFDVGHKSSPSARMARNVKSNSR